MKQSKLTPAVRLSIIISCQKNSLFYVAFLMSIHLIAVHCWQDMYHCIVENQL